MHERQDLGEARGKSETEKARQNLESEVLVRLNGLSEMSGLRPRSRDGRKSRTVTIILENFFFYTSKFFKYLWLSRISFVISYKFCGFQYL